MNKNNFLRTFLIFLNVLILANCKGSFPSENYAPGDIPVAIISGVSVSGGSVFYCSISGGCPVTVSGKNFYKNAKVYIGSYICLNNVVSETRDKITCTVGPGQNGVYNISVQNTDGRASVWDTNISDPSLYTFSYASFLYLGSQETPGKVYGYAQHPTTGALLNLVGSPFSISGHNGTYGAVIHPNNKFLYSANVSSGTVSMFSITPETGALISLGTPINSGGGNPNGLFFHPSGKFLYVTNQSGNSVTGFNVDTAGLLTTITGSPFPTVGASNINGIVVSHDGKFLYAAGMGGNGGVSAFTINQTTGSLTNIVGSPFINTMGGDTTNPGDGISIHPNNKWLYMGLTGLRKISAWNIDQTTGALMSIEAPILNNSTTGFVDNGGSASTVSDDGLFLYGTAFSTTIADPKKIVTYSINQTTGGLMRVSNVDTGGGPNDVRIDISGNYAYTCNSVNPASVSAYSVNKATGTLTPLAQRDYLISGAPPSGPGIMVIQK